MSKLDEIREYRDNPSVNYSTLKQVLENKKKTFKGSLAATLGNTVDCLLTMPQHFNELFTVKDIKRPTDKLSLIMDAYVEELDYENIENLSYHLESLLLRCREESYGGTTYKDDTIRNNILKLEFWWDILCEKNKKEIITQKEYNYGKKLVNILKTTNPGLAVLSHKVQYQTPLYGSIKVRGIDVPLKALPDIIYEYDNKMFYVDLKTTEFSDWGFAVRKQSLMLQMCITTHLLKQIYGKEVVAGWLVCNGYKVKLIPCSPVAIEYGLQSSRTVLDYTYCPTTDTNSIREIYNPSVTDLIARWQDCINLNLPDWDLEHHRNGGFYDYLNIYE